MQVQVIVIIFPTSRDDRYSAVKRLCCVDMPVPSQVIISNTIGQQQKLRAVTQKIALQINCKLGGELWAVNIPLQNVMVVGVDVYHDVTRGRQSVLGLVASMNRNMTRWFSKCAFQDPGKELVNCLKVALLEALVKYYEVNHCRPDRIFIFRDGVGDGQLKHVDEYEIEQVISAFPCLSPGYNPSIAVVIVQKRINTRIFTKLVSKEDCLSRVVLMELTAELTDVEIVAEATAEQPNEDSAEVDPASTDGAPLPTSAEVIAALALVRRHCSAIAGTGLSLMDRLDYIEDAVVKHASANKKQATLFQ
ncbi:hypothetical protein HPB51_021956 [Rhipicephalus microplus]|uniref:Piwi domain-containing protein n=1 Tax=Rhipicephalus microplus TaxID=6941 RepID=A0A9J6EIJ9_RHIMP|nr:hypothetical protein HPB51_021956 [Rhipicephalus microplus]